MGRWPIACTAYAVHRDGVGWLRAAGRRAFSAALCCWLLGCTRAPADRFSLESLKVTGNSAFDDEDIQEKLASRETPRFLGLFPGVIYDYEIFNRFVLERDLQRIERFYQSRGYYQAHARAAHVFRTGAKVRVEIVVEEGEPVLLRRLDIHGLEHLPAKVRSQALAAATSGMPLGAPFEEEKFEQASKDLARSLGDHGFAEAKVRKGADVNLPKNSASVGFWVEAGPASEFGELRFEGLADLPEDKIRRTAALEPGTPYSQSELDETKRALLDLGVFASVEVEVQVDAAQPGPNGVPRIPILVRVEKAKLRSVHVGGGISIDTLRSDVHLTFGWEDQSFFGGLRKLQVEVVPGVVLYPTRFPSFEAPKQLLPEARFRTEFRQPGFVEARTNAVLKAQVEIGPALLSPKHDPDAPIIGYRDYRASAGVERSFYRLYGYLTQNLQLSQPFVYSGNKDPALGQVLVSYPALFTTFDLRNDAIHPHKGLYVANELEVAGLGGDARDVKLQPEVRGYIPLSKRVTLAARGTLGFLFAGNYGQTVLNNALHGQSGLGDDSDPEIRKRWVHDIQLMFLRGFFSGGSGSNRGYAAREIGPNGAVPFYNHGQSANNPDVDCATDPTNFVCNLPLGGFTLWETNLELRFPLVAALSGAVFGDASDVSPRRLSLRWRPHLSIGFGLRYDTPVGPIRFDLGYRVPGLQAPASAQDEGQPGEIFGAPLAASFGIGESF
jgi:outer membrane protein assembly factor BamA